ncbi:type IV toxin-antitoxin system AbiEi family antitoxin domain-containing protein [Paucilactobacillus wasatchensis]|nr:abortive infection protein [Paucilactobacillus wasatchensis]
MTKLNSLKRLEHDFPTFTYKTAQQYDLSKYELHELSNDGTIYKIDRGVYIFPGYLLDEFSLLSQRFSRGVFSLISALIIHNLTDEMSLHYDIVFPQGYHPATGTLKENNIRARYLSKKYYSLGITTKKTENASTVRVYSVERTLLDVWESNEIEPYVKNEALKRYLSTEVNATQIKSLNKLKDELYPSSTLLKTLEVYSQ